tara:strand:- start:410 stop:598 length:189 start_codon:yes stop_codon:yes gene_type:complete
MKIKKKKLLKYFKELGKTYQKEAEIAARDAEELKAIEEEIISRFVRHYLIDSIDIDFKETKN